MNLDLGGGTKPEPGYQNLDPVHGVGNLKRRVQEGIPFSANSLAAVRASHLFEHIPAGQERIDAFNDVHRVLMPGGTFEVILPLFPSWQAIADPTHISFWVRESFHYFTGALSAQADYGMKMWKEISWDLLDGWEAHWIAEPIK